MCVCVISIFLILTVLFSQLCAMVEKQMANEMSQFLKFPFSINISKTIMSQSTLENYVPKKIENHLQLCVSIIIKSFFFIVAIHK